MPAAPERNREGAWLAWRALALVASLRIAQAVPGSPPVPPAVYGAGLALWLILGWRARRPAWVAAGIAAALAAMGRFWLGLPAGFLLFIPAWAALFQLPAAFRREGWLWRIAARLCVRARAVGAALAAFARWTERFPRTFECLRLCLAAGSGLLALGPFLHDGIMGGVDARWYTAVVADHLQQWRMGLWPVFVGQTHYAAVGTVMPLRVAPYLQHVTVALDMATGRSLSPYLLLNLALVGSSVAGCLSAYLCMRAILGARRMEALLLAIIYSWCPAVCGLAYTGQLFMSLMTLPYLPIVFAGVVMIFRCDGFAGWAMVAGGCAACWLAHSPIGLWVSIAAATALGARWILRTGLNRRELARLVCAAALFAGLCGYVFVSLFVLAPPPQPPISGTLVAETLRGLFPAALLPVSANAASNPDLQPGWGILAVLAFALVGALKAPAGAARALLATAVVLICLSMPVPGLNAWLWGSVPQAVLNATNEVPTQRLFPILAACSVVFAASVLAAAPRRRAPVLLGLALCAAWSGVQLRPFLRRGALLGNSAASSEQALAQENLALTVFSNGFFSVNSFFSYGYMDFALEQRVLSEDMDRYMVTNVGAVAPGYDFDVAVRRPHPPADGVLSGTPSPTGRRWIDIAPRLTLAPGRHYLLALDFGDHPYAGVLQANMNGLSREYILPQSGERYSFGTGPMNSRVIPLWNPSRAAATVGLDFVVQDDGADLSQFAEFARYRLIPYGPGDLPIRLESLVPFVARVRSPAPGWYESFRYFTPGWTASVNGAPAALRKSPNGLVAVHVAAGESEVRLGYRPPPALLSAYWLAWASWCGLALWTARRLWRR